MCQDARSLYGLGKFQGSLCWALSQFPPPEKERGIRLSPSAYQSLSYASWHRDSTSLQVRVFQALDIIYIQGNWIICRHHKAAGTLSSDCNMFYTGYCGDNASGGSESVGILNEPNKLIPACTASPKKTVL